MNQPSTIGKRVALKRQFSVDTDEETGEYVFEGVLDRELIDEIKRRLDMGEYT